MTHGTLVPKILLFAVPLLFSSMLQLMFNAADIVVVGRFGRNGAASVAAVGSTGALINLIVALFVGISVGVNVLAARYYASAQVRSMSETVGTAVMVGFFGGIIIGVVGIVIAEPVLGMMGTPDDVLPLAASYMRIYFAGAPALLVYNMGSAILRAVGDTRRPLLFLIISGVVNVALNMFFVMALDMDVSGVAVATVISEIISALLILMCLVRTDESYRLILKRSSFSFKKLAMMLKVGVPAGLQGMIFSFSNVLIQSSVNSFGSVAMAGNAAAVNLEGFVYMAMNSIYQASVSFTGQNYGAGDLKRVNRVLADCLAIVAVVGLVMGNAFYFFGDKLLSLYTDDVQAMEYGMKRIAVICTLYFLCGTMDTVCGSLRGLGWSFVPMIVSLIGACGFRIVWIYTYFAKHHDLTVLYMSYPISWAVTGTVHFICYLLIMRHIKKRHGEKGGVSHD
ncbi:MAG: MATE family efflux transporter [Lachnospiraceae bacterium]|nr:MATE family efflux transporter [Lachnospiraceae bacterium]